MKKIGIYNNTSEVIDKKLIRNVAKYTLSKLNVNSCEANIIFVGLDEIHSINLEYRHIDRPTDVISFALEDAPDGFENDVRVLGDIYICVDKAREQAIEYGHSEKREISFLVVHGLLHLLGFDHMEVSDEKIMFGLQEEILNELEITR